MEEGFGGCSRWDHAMGIVTEYVVFETVMDVLIVEEEAVIVEKVQGQGKT